MKNKIFSILKKELREVFRDKKSLSMMLIIPIMIPLLVIGMSSFFDYQINKNIDNSYNVGFNYKLSDYENELTKNVKFKNKIDNEKNLEKLLEDGKLDFFITKKDNKYTIHYDQNIETSTLYVTVAEQYLNSYKSILQANYLDEFSINSKEVLDIITIDYKTISKKNNSFYANYITTYAFLFIIMAITISATYPATDATAGERERGTLETLLTFPIKSRDIIVGKFLSVSFSSIVTGMISLILMVISLIVANQSFDIYKDVNLMLSPASFVFATIVIGAYSFLISGLCIAIASKSKSFKEAQSALTPLTFISFFPSFIAFMMELKIGVVSSLIPFLNFTLLFTDIVNGNFNLLYVLLVVLSTAITIFLVLKIIISQYKSEKVLFVN